MCVWVMVGVGCVGNKIENVVNNQCYLTQVLQHKVLLCCEMFMCQQKFEILRSDMKL